MNLHGAIERGWCSHGLHINSAGLLDAPYVDAGCSFCVKSK